VPDLKTAAFRHAAHYLQVLDRLNDAFIQDGGNQAKILVQFDAELENARLAQHWLFQTSQTLSAEEIEGDRFNHAIVDLCNAYPDAAAYLLNAHLPPEERLRWVEQALSASQKLGNDRTSQAHLGNLGLAYSQQGELHQALSCFEQALALAEKLGDEAHQSAWLGDLGNIHAALGEHRQAIQYQEKALTLAKKSGHLRAEGHASGNLGVSYAALGQHQSAQRWYQQYLEIARQTGDQRDEGLALLNLGFTAFDLVQLDLAREYLQQSFEIAQDLGNDDLQSLALGGLADIAIDQKEYEQAGGLLQEALESCRRAGDTMTELRILGSLGNLHNASEKHAQAFRYHQQQAELAGKVGSTPHLCHAQINQVSLFRKEGQFEEALSLAEAAFVLSRQIESQADEAFLNWQVGLVYENLGQVEQALFHLQSAVRYEIENNHPDAQKNLAHLNRLKERAQTS